MLVYKGLPADKRLIFVQYVRKFRNVHALDGVYPVEMVPIMLFESSTGVEPLR